MNNQNQLASGPPIELGDVISRSWDVFAKNIGLILLLCAIATLPTVVFYIGLDQIFTPQNELRPNVGGADIGITLIGFIAIIVVSILINVIALATFLQTCRTGKTFSIGEAFKESSPHFGPVIAVSLVVGLIIFLGLIALIIPGLLFALWYIYTALITIDEPKLGIRGALSKSRAMFMGDKAIIIYWILIGIAISFASSAVTFPITFVVTLISPIAASTFSSLLSAIIGYFYLIGFVHIYLAVSKKHAATNPAEVAPAS